jgi:Zn-finger protein
MYGEGHRFRRSKKYLQHNKGKIIDCAECHIARSLAKLNIVVSVILFKGGIPQKISKAIPPTLG